MRVVTLYNDKFFGFFKFCSQWPGSHRPGPLKAKPILPNTRALCFSYLNWSRHVRTALFVYIFMVIWVVTRLKRSIFFGFIARSTPLRFDGAA